MSSAIERRGGSTGGGGVHVVGVLRRTQDYCTHAGRSEITYEDVHITRKTAWDVMKANLRDMAGTGPTEGDTVSIAP